jgi:DNA-binding HxlR family transcriptional regulator
MPRTALPNSFAPLVSCEQRILLDQLQITEKWTFLILYGLLDGPMRFNQIKRRVEGITQKMLTQSVRTLERNGLVLRDVLSTSPVSVQYSVTELGTTLSAPIAAMYSWIESNRDAVMKARKRYDAKHKTHLPDKLVRGSRRAS